MDIPGIWISLHGTCGHQRACYLAQHPLSPAPACCCPRSVLPSASHVRRRHHDHGPLHSSCHIHVATLVCCAVLQSLVQWRGPDLL